MNAVSFASAGLQSDRPATVQQYGALPWRRDRQGRIRVLLVTSSRGRWIAPKGWPVEGRAPYLSAALEAFEEAGVIGEIRSQPLAGYHCLKEGEDGSLQRCRVTLFSLRVRGTLTNWPERDRRKRRWFALDEAAEMVDDEGKQRQWRAYAASLELENVSLKSVIDAVWQLVGPPCGRIAAQSRDET